MRFWISILAVIAFCPLPGVALPARSGLLLTSAALDLADQPTVPANSLPILPLSSVQTHIEQAIKKDQPQFNGSVFILQNANLIYRGNFGFIKNHVPFDDESPFILASASKQFTAALILKQVERGTLELDSSITHYLPSAPAAWSLITIRQLLSHTAGLDDYLEHYHSANTPDQVNLTTDQILASIYKLESHPKVGVEFFYSNSGYFVLGKILEYVTHQTYAELMEQDIFQPLGMTHSGVLTTIMQFPTEQTEAERVAHQILRATQPNVVFAVGGVYSSISDLVTWEKALFLANGFLRPDLWAEMKIAQPLTEQTVDHHEVGYGFGLHLTKSGGKNIIWHTGHINGHTVMLEYILEDQLSMVILTNATNAPVRELSNSVLADVFAAPELPISQLASSPP